MKNILKKVNWQYAIGELLLIFMGISLALWFNNWNDYQKQRQQEIQILSEILEELEDDIHDISGNKKAHELGIRSANAFIQYYTGKDTLAADSIPLYLSYIYRNYTSISNTASYDYLKSVGISIISDDSLRRKLTKLYDVTYENIRKIEEQHQPTQFFKNNKDLFWEHMGDKFTYSPTRFVALKPYQAKDERLDVEFIYKMLEQITALKEDIKLQIETLQ